jgi:hypothetical protein
MACQAEARQSEGWSQTRVLPSAELAYKTGLSAGSIAMLAHEHPGTRPQKWSPHPESRPPTLRATAGQAELARLPSESITGNALGAGGNGLMDNWIDG